jgi:membrane fusion protein, copper/silver efflux system
MNTNKKTILFALATLAVGLLLGWLIFGGSEANLQTNTCTIQN